MKLFVLADKCLDLFIIFIPRSILSISDLYEADYGLRF